MREWPFVVDVSSNVYASGENTPNLLSHVRTHYPSHYTQVLQLQKSKAKEKMKSLQTFLRCLQQTKHPSLNCLPERKSMKSLRDDSNGRY